MRVWRIFGVYSSLVLDFWYHNSVHCESRLGTLIRTSNADNEIARVTRFDNLVKLNTLGANHFTFAPISFALTSLGYIFC